MRCTRRSPGRSGYRSGHRAAWSGGCLAPPRGDVRPPAARGRARGRRRRRVRAPARGPPRPLRPHDRRFPARAAPDDGGEGRRRRAPAERELPAPHRVRAAALPRAHAGRARGALGPGPRAGALPPARRRGAHPEPARPAPPGRRGAPALPLDGRAVAARHGAPRHAEESPRLRRDRPRGPAGTPGREQRRRRRLRRVGGAGPRPRPPRRARRGARRDEASGPRACRAQCRRRPPPASLPGRAPARHRRDGVRPRLALRDGAVSALPRARFRTSPGAHRLRGPARGRHRLVVPGGARQRRAVGRARAGRLADGPVHRRPPADRPLHGLRRDLRGHDALRAPGRRLGPTPLAVRGGRAQPARVGGGRVGLPRIERGQAGGADPDGVPRR